jgi:hypothetical protein
MKKIISVLLTAILLTGLVACDDKSNNDNKDKNTTTSAKVTEKGDKTEKADQTEKADKTEEPDNEQIVKTEFDPPEVLSMKLNGGYITLPISFEELEEKTGFKETEGSLGSKAITDGYSKFDIYFNEDDDTITMIQVQAPGTTEFYPYDRSKTEIIFPGGLTMDTTKKEIEDGLFPYKGVGRISEFDDVSEKYERFYWHPTQNQHTSVLYIDFNKDTSKIEIIHYSNYGNGELYYA